MPELVDTPTFDNPGSWHNYLKDRTDPAVLMTPVELRVEYDRRCELYRETLAAARQLTREELHIYPLPIEGQTNLAAEPEVKIKTPTKWMLQR